MTDINSEKFDEILKDERYEELLGTIRNKLAMLWRPYQIINYLIEERAIEPADKPKIRAIIKQVKKYDAEKKTSKEEKNRDSVNFWESIISDEKSTIKERRLARANLDRLINQDNAENPEDPETYAAKLRKLINDGQACTGASKLHFTDEGLFDPILSEDGNMLPCPTQDDKDKRDKKRAEAWLVKQKNINVD